MNLGLIILVICIILIALISVSYIAFFLFSEKHKAHRNGANLKSILLAFSITFLVVDLAILLPLTFSSTLWKEGDKFDYKDYREINVKDIFNSDEHYVYFYSYACSVCEEIKEEVLGHFQDETSFFVLNIDKNRSELNFTFADENSCLISGGVYENNFCTVSIYNYKNKMLGVKNIDDFYLLGTPTLLEIKEGCVEGIFVGDSEILNKISEE